MKVNICWIDDIGQEFLSQSLEVSSYDDAITKIEEYHLETKDEAISLVEGYDDLEYLTLYVDSNDKELDGQLLKSIVVDELGI